MKNIWRWSLSIITNRTCDRSKYIVCKKLIQYYSTYWGRATHICVSKQIIIGSDNGVSPGRRQAIIRTNAGISLIWTMGTNFSEILSEFIHFHSRKYIWKCCLEIGVILSRPQCVKTIGLNNLWWCSIHHIWLSSNTWYVIHIVD